MDEQSLYVCHGIIKGYYPIFIPRSSLLSENLVEKKFESTPFWWRSTGELSKDRTEGYISFQVVDIEFTGPITCKIKEKKEGKACIILSCDSLSRALYLEIRKYKILMEFLKSLKRFIARRGKDLLRKWFNIWKSYKMASKVT